MDRLDVRNRINWLVFFRFVLLLGAISALQVIDPASMVHANVSVTLRYLLALILANLCYFWLNQYWAVRSWLIGQLVLDCLAETGLLYLTGGVNSPFTVVYFATIVASAIMVSGYLSYICASLAATGQAIVTTVYFYFSHYREMPLPYLPPAGFLDIERSLNVYIYYLLVQTSSFYLVAFLGARLADQLSEDKIVQEEILQNLGEGVIVTDTQGHVVYANRSAAAQLNTRPGALQGRDLVTFLNRLSPTLARNLMARHAGLHEIDLEDNGRITPLHISLSPLRGKRDTPRGMICLIRDRTVNRELEQSRLTVERMRVLHEVAAGIAHEIRNPLASIRGSVQELSGRAGDATAEKLMRIVVRETDRLNNIITDFLAYAVLKKAAMHRVDLKQIVEETVLLLGKREDAQGVAFATTFTPMPGDAPDWTLQADGAQLRQVFINILVNAIQATNAATGRAAIQVDVRPVERFQSTSADDGTKSYTLVRGFQVAVTDHGVGMAPATMENIFLPFFTTKTQGTGMGLAIVNRIVTEHGGTTTVQSAPDNGATFTIWLPESPVELPA